MRARTERPCACATSRALGFGPDTRRGLVELDGEGEAVGGIVVMRYGENALAVIDAVKLRIDELRAGLPEGVELVTAYDRSELIRAAIGTLRTTLLEEMAVVALVIFVFLLHARSALIPILTIPIGVALAFVPMYYQGLNANLMSLGGLAVAIGAMVDAAIIGVENAHDRLEAWERAGRPGARADVILAAMQEVGPSLFFALLVITVSFLPIFALEGAEGRLFKPLAFTKTYAMAAAALLSVTLTPALATLLIRGRIRGEQANPLNRWLVRGYAPVVRAVVRRRGLVILLALLAMASALPPFLRLGSEFMPPLHEGTLLYMPTAPPGMSVAEASRVLGEMDRELREVPEVTRVFGKIGRAETPTDSAPLSMVETIVQIAPRERWRPVLTWDSLVAELDRELPRPGLPNLWWMPTQTRTEMLATGVRGPRGQGVRRQPGRRRARSRRDRAGAARRPRHPQRVRRARERRVVPRRGGRPRARGASGRVESPTWNETLRAAIGGVSVGQTVKGRARYALNVRSARRTRRCAGGRTHADRERERRADPSELAKIASAPARTWCAAKRASWWAWSRSTWAGERSSTTWPTRSASSPSACACPRARVSDGRASSSTSSAPRARLMLVLPLTLAPGRVAALPEHALGVGAGARAARGTFLADRRGLAAVRARLPPVGRGLGRHHRARGARRADGSGDAAVPDAWRCASARRAGVARGRPEAAMVDGAARRIRPKLMTVLDALLGLLPLL